MNTCWFVDDDDDDDEPAELAGVGIGVVEPVQTIWYRPSGPTTKSAPCSMKEESGAKAGYALAGAVATG